MNSKRWRIPATLLLAATLALPAASAQTRRAKKPAAPAAVVNPDEWPISAITIEGNHHFTAKQILTVAGLAVGQKVNKAALEVAHDRLVASGAFDGVGYEYAPGPGTRGVTVKFQVEEVNAFYTMLFEDLPVKEADLRAWLQQKDVLFGPKISATKEALAHYQALIGEYLAAHGSSEPITARLSAENPPDLVILFRPQTARPSVAQVTAVNTGEILPGVVQSTLYGVATGTIYSEPRMRQLLDTSIRPLYEEKGRLRVTFPSITAKPAEDVKGVAVTVTVEQGPVFQFGKIQVTGADTSILEMSKVLKVKTGELADFGELREAEGRIEERFRHNGYLRVNTEILRDVHDASKIADVTIRITTGPLFTFRELKIVGLDIVSEPVIRKLWGMAPGKPYNPGYADHFLQVVKEQGLFDNLKNVESERHVNYDDHTVDVTITFK